MKAWIFGRGGQSCLGNGGLQGENGLNKADTAPEVSVLFQRHKDAALLVKDRGEVRGAAVASGDNLLKGAAGQSDGRFPFCFRQHQHL